MKNENDGYIPFNFPESPPEDCTVLVFNVSRSGTSILSSYFVGAGIAMPDCQSPTYESIEISDALDARDYEKVRSIAKEYNKKYKNWGGGGSDRLYRTTSQKSQTSCEALFALFRSETL